MRRVTLASGGSLVSYSADAATLTVNLDAGSNVTVKSNNLYTLTNSLGTTTQCSGTAYSFITLIAGSPSAVTFTPSTTIACPAASTGGGGGGGGAIIIPPTISSFLAYPASILPGQSSTLSWSLTGASSITITPSVSTSSLNPVTGTATVTPSTTTIYTLVAANAFGQSVTATTTVTVVAGSAGTQPLPVSGPANPLPPPPTPSTVPAYCLVNRAGTFSLILNGIRHGIADPGLLLSWGYNFNDSVLDTAAYQSLPTGDLLGPEDGALVKAPGSPTVYLISGQAKRGFNSASVFRGLGYKFSSVLTIPAPQLDGLTKGFSVSNRSVRHLPGANVSSRGTVYFLGETARFPYTSLAVFNTWNLHNDFSRVVPANAADLRLPLGATVNPRSNCASQ